jgi:hypothetical protein
MGIAVVKNNEIHSSLFSIRTSNKVCMKILKRSPEMPSDPIIDRPIPKCLRHGDTYTVR